MVKKKGHSDWKYIVKFFSGEVSIPCNTTHYISDLEHQENRVIAGLVEGHILEL